VNPTWWGEFEIADDGKWHRWQVGPAVVRVQHRPGEWQIAVRPGDDPVSEELVVNEILDAEPDDGAVPVRFARHRSGTGLQLVPLTTDRPVIVRSSQPFQVPPGEETTIYVSTPLRIGFEAGRGKLRLLEEALFRPSDTWFGPSPREGELCYASTTAARLSLENLPIRPHRAVTVVQIRNRATTLLPLERIRLPMPQLSLYGSREGWLWTETVTLERRAADELAEIRLARGAPEQAGECQRVAGPRQATERGALIRSFGGLLGGFRRIHELVD
jgi:hypothetical protein